ncbi:MAG: sigma 54-interacting transcriptional regulator [Candidatus Adiutrix sp.]|jgi:PAS domain S-box-containing protein|nr:sigma 54-interacting transcriptional regulator [Candidatus Adiutrix sp.]
MPKPTPDQVTGQPSAEPSFLLDDVLNGIPVAVMVIDRHGRVDHANQEMATLLGLPAWQLRGVIISEFWPKSAHEIMQAARSGRQAAALLITELDDCFAQIYPLPGNSPGATISIFDRRLRQLYMDTGPTLDPLTPYYKRIFESSSDGISISDRHGRLILVNQASARHVGLEPEELQGRMVAWLTERKLTDGAVTYDVINTRKPVTKLIKHTKTNKFILLTGTPIFSPDGQVHLVVINERDLTNLLELRTSLKQQKELIARFKDELKTMQLAELAVNDLVAISPSMRLTVETAVKLAQCGAPQILITGESGTGKGLLAKFIHANSLKAEEPFIHINCAALPESLLEAELFGYEKGAFTGAAPEGRAGLFEVAGQGAAFLDEIGEMPLSLQAKLLTFLDNHQFRRIGGHKVITASCSLIAATNQNLEQLAARKKFRQDLYYRLNVFRLHLAPLRERSEDIVELARREVTRLGERYGQKRELDSLAIEVIKSYPFPGNVRELLNSLQQAAFLSDVPQLGPFLAKTLKTVKPGAAIGAASSAEELRPAPFSGKERPREEPSPASLGNQLAETERSGLTLALTRCRTTREMAETLGISQASVSRKLKKYGLKPPGFKGRAKKR